jgi:hypothetical protein
MPGVSTEEALGGSVLVRGSAREQSEKCKGN